MRSTTIPWVVWLLLGLLVYTHLHALGSAGYTGYCVVRVYADGGVMLEYRLSVEGAPANITLRVPREAVYISVSDGGDPAPYSYDEARGLLSFTTFTGRVTVRVYSLGLTSKEGAIWRLQLGAVDLETLLALPGEALIVSVEPRDFGVRLVNNTLHLVFKPGSTVRVEYTLIPATQPAPPPGQVAPTTTVKEAPTTWLLLALGALALLAAAGALLLRARRGASRLVEVATVEEALDERDKLILETLKNVGEATAPTLQKATGIPKTPLYRKLEKLEKMGLIESEWRGGAKVYRVKLEKHT
ncbi:MAG: helix-turn-helix transcriptional regulator [Acidilobaceae archaeon]